LVDLRDALWPEEIAAAEEQAKGLQPRVALIPAF
jgi:hypothetical protein